MTFVVLDICINCKYTDCVEVCPVDCFYEGENMLVIHPDECIDCGVCEPECPIEAIVPDSDERADKFLEMNREFSEKWPVITRAKPEMPNASENAEKPNKYPADFSEKPGEGDQPRVFSPKTLCFQKISYLLRKVEIWLTLCYITSTQTRQKLRHSYGTSSTFVQDE